MVPDIRRGARILFLRRRVPENGPLKAAVIGAGAFGRHHATKYRALSESGQGVELFAIADPSPEVRRTAVAQFGVLAEKPIATTIEEANDLVALAKQTRRVLTVGHQERFVFARTGLLGQAETP